MVLKKLSLAKAAVSCPIAAVKAKSMSGRRLTAYPEVVQFRTALRNGPVPMVHAPCHPC